jgi:hypothetical protein
LLAKEAKELGSMKEAKSLLEDSSAAALRVQDVRRGELPVLFMLNGCPACEKESG